MSIPRPERTDTILQGPLNTCHICGVSVEQLVTILRNDRADMLEIIAERDVNQTKLVQETIRKAVTESLTQDLTILKKEKIDLSSSKPSQRQNSNNINTSTTRQSTVESISMFSSTVQYSQSSSMDDTMNHSSHSIHGSKLNATSSSSSPSSSIATPITTPTPTTANSTKSPFELFRSQPSINISSRETQEVIKQLRPNILTSADPINVQLFLHAYANYVSNGGDAPLQSLLSHTILDSILFELRKGNHKSSFESISDIYSADSELLYMAMTERFTLLDSLTLQQAFSKIILLPNITTDSINDYCRRYKLMSEFFLSDDPDEYQSILISSFLDNIQPLVLQQLVRNTNPSTLDEATIRLRELGSQLIQLTLVIEQAATFNSQTSSLSSSTLSSSSLSLLPPEWIQMIERSNSTQHSSPKSSPYFSSSHSSTLPSTVVLPMTSVTSSSSSSSSSTSIIGTTDLSHSIASPFVVILNPTIEGNITLGPIKATYDSSSGNGIVNIAFFQKQQDKNVPIAPSVEITTFDNKSILGNTHECVISFNIPKDQLTPRYIEEKESDPQRLAEMSAKKAARLAAEALKADEEAKKAAEQMLLALKKEIEKEIADRRKQSEDEITLAKTRAAIDLEDAKRKIQENQSIADTLLNKAKRDAERELDDSKAEADHILEQARLEAMREAQLAAEAKKLADMARENAIKAKREEEEAARKAQEERDMAIIVKREAERLKEQAEAERQAAEDLKRRTEELRRKQEENEIRIKAELKADAERRMAEEAALIEAHRRREAEEAAALRAMIEKEAQDRENARKREIEAKQRELETLRKKEEETRQREREREIEAIKKAQEEEIVKQQLLRLQREKEREQQQQQREEADRKAYEINQKLKDDEEKKFQDQIDAERRIALIIRKQEEETIAEAIRIKLESEEKERQKAKDREESLVKAKKDEEARLIAMKTAAAKAAANAANEVKPVDANTILTAVKGLPHLNVDPNFDDIYIPQKVQPSTNVLTLSSPQASKSPSLSRTSSFRDSLKGSRQQSPMSGSLDRRLSTGSLSNSNLWSTDDTPKKKKGYTPKLYTFGKEGVVFPQTPNGAGASADMNCCSYRFCSCKVNNLSPKISMNGSTGLEETRSPEVRYLVDLSSEIPSIEKVASILDILIHILTNFKCNKVAAEIFATRLQRVATILARLFKTYRQFNQTEVKALLDDLGETLIEAKKYLMPFSKPGYLLTLLKGSESKTKFEGFDASIVKTMTHITAAFVASTDSRNLIQSVDYNQFVVIDESALILAHKDTEALKALSRLIGADINDITQEVNNTIKALAVMLQAVSETGAQRQLKHPALKTFWRVNLSSVYKLYSEELVARSCKYIRSDVLPDINEDDLSLISNKLLDSLELVDENDDSMMSVFQLNRLTKHIDITLDFAAVLERLWNQQAIRVIPAIGYKYKDQITWGEGLQSLIQKSMSGPSSSNSWTIIYGPVQSGKTYRYLVASHDLDLKDSVLYIDCYGITTSTELLSSVATQLSLPVMTLEDVVLSFQRLLSMNSIGSDKNSMNHICVILDHVNLSQLEPLTPILKALKTAQQRASSSIAIVLISSHVSKPSNDIVDDIVKSGGLTIPYNSVKFVEIGCLADDEAIALAKYFEVYNAELLAKAARALPGRIQAMSNLRSESLLTILNRDMSSEEIIVSGSGNGSGTSPNRNDSMGQKMKETIGEAVTDILTNDERLCAICLYFPMVYITKNTIISKAIAWRLCRRALNDNINLFTACIHRLISLGWLKPISDEGYILSEYATLPTYSYHPTLTIDESSQAEIYYSYLVEEIVRISDLLQSKDQILGLEYFDSMRKHFQIIFSSLGYEPPMYPSILPQVVHELTSQISNTISSILDYRIHPNESLLICKAILRILCEGDDSGLNVDTRLWNKTDVILYQGAVVRGVVNLGWYMFRTNQLIQAEKILATALSHLSESDGSNYAYALNKMGIIQRAMGNNEEALQTHEKCLWLRVSVVGEKHPDTAQSLNNIAIVLNSLNHIEESLSIHERCLAVRLEVLGETHAHTGDTYYNMAGALVSLRRYEEAIACFQKARLAYVWNYGEGHSYVKDIDKQIDTIKQTKVLK